MGIKLLVPAIASILILGTISIIPQSFAGNGLEDCAFHILFEGFPLEETGRDVAECPDGVFNTIFPVFVEYKPPLVNGVTSNDVEAEQVVHIELPNFIDKLNTKKVRVQILYDTQDTTPVISNVKPKFQTEDSCLFKSTTTIPGQGDLAVLDEIWICHPNPDNERIWIDIGRADIRSVIVWTVSFDSSPVGGDMLQMETVSILAAGAQYTAAWMIPVIVSGIGIAIVIARKF